MSTPFMSMSLPVVGVTPGGNAGSAWGPLLTGALAVVDAHDHSPGKGAPLNMSSGSLTITSDIDWGGHGIYDMSFITASGTISAAALSGSLTQFTPKGSSIPLAAFIGIGGILVSTNSSGQVTISSSAGDDKFASYVLAQPDAENPNFRVLSGTNGITVTDNGPGTTISVALSVPTGSMTPTQHELLLQLVHLANEDGPRGQLWTSGAVRDTGPWPFPTASIWWTDSTRAKKFLTNIVTRNSKQLIISSSWTVYQSDGVTVADSFTDSFVYNGVFETSRTRTTP